jgi:hypothetical protein
VQKRLENAKNALEPLFECRLKSKNGSKWAKMLASVFEVEWERPYPGKFVSLYF